jgi:short-subunit dehydrogenase
MTPPKTIVITGASSGIGAALAKAYAKPGVILGLLGRNTDRLAEVASYCNTQGAKAETASIDVRDAAVMKQWLKQFDAVNPIELLIVNAGIATTLSGQGESDLQTRDIFAINVDGVINSVLPAIALMKPRKKGQIALMSSLAGIRGLPSCPAYSASKNAVRAFAEGLRGELQSEGINVTAICPGFIKTPLTDINPFPMPFIMSAEKAASIIMRGLAANRARIAFPLALYIPLRIISCLPLAITDPFFAALPSKNATTAL